MRAPIVVGLIAALLAAVLVLGRGAELGPNPFVVIGILNGVIFGLFALGLVLVYKGARVFNFAQGEFGTLGAFFLLVGIGTLDLPYWVAVLAALVAVAVVGVVFERIFVRPLLNAPRVLLLVATIAAALLMIGLEILIARIEPRSLPPLIEGGESGMRLFDVLIEPQRLVSIAVFAALSLLLVYFFSRTDRGIAILATSQDAFATRVVGIGLEGMSMLIWTSAAVLGGLAGILYMPITGILHPGAMTLLILIPAFTAAVLGGMTSLPGAFVGGMVIGVVQQLSLWASGTVHIGDQVLADVVPGSEWVTLMLLLLVVLLARPQGLLGTEA